MPHTPGTPSSLPAARLLPVLLLALALRLLFFQGFAFSDDAHYGWLAAHAGSGYGDTEPGYPVMPLRVGHIALLSVSQHLAGPGDWGLALYPLVFSLGMVAVAWRLGWLLTGNGLVGSRAALLLALLPVDIALSTLAFADLGAAAVLGTGIWLLLEARLGSRSWPVVPGALLVGGSLLWKETALWLLPLLGVIQLGLWWRGGFRRPRPDPTLLAAGLGILAVLGAEMVAYRVLEGQALWRFQRMELNTRLCPDDFFKAGSAKGYPEPADYPAALARLLLLEHPKDLFLRRNTLFIAGLALVQLVIRLRRGQPGIHGLWYGGLLLAFAFGSTSLQRYQPLPLDLPWYIFPLFLPAALLAGELLARVPRNRFPFVLLPLVALSLWMSRDFQHYFDQPGLERIRAALTADPESTVHGDAFSLLSLDHLDGRPARGRGRPLEGSRESLDHIVPGDLLLLNPGNIRELRAQGRTLPDPPGPSDLRFTLMARGGGFEVHRCTAQP